MEEKHPQVSIDPRALKHLCDHSWPGNVRELKNAIEFSLAVCANEKITMEDLPEEIVASSDSHSGESSGLSEVSSSLAQSEKETIEKVYRACGFNKKKTAEKLGITRATLYKRLEKYELG
jgi:DNA-binding NtrC family response regulator